MEQEKAPETSTFAELQAVSTRSEHLGLREGGRRVAGGHRSPHLLLPGPGPTLLLTCPPELFLHSEPANLSTVFS